MHFEQLDLNLLVALDALLTERSITTAGVRVHLTQSAMSGALSRLREFFNDDLLTQVGRKMVPDALGGKPRRAGASNPAANQGHAGGEARFRPGNFDPTLLGDDVRLCRHGIDV
jgi:LysR family nod box-dependent transcriptional activator